MLREQAKESQAKPNSNQRHHQKELRRKRDERAFLFDSTMSKCLAEVERNNWEWAIEMAGGSVSEAAASAAGKQPAAAAARSAAADRGDHTASRAASARR